MARKKKVLSTAEAGSKGGKARAANMTPEERSESSRRASLARWAPKTPEEKREATEKMRMGRRKK